MSDPAAHAQRYSIVQKLLRGVTWCATRMPGVTVVWCLTLAVVSVWYTSQCLQFKTSRADLIDPRADYQQRWNRYTQSFGEVADMVVVIEGDKPETIAAVVMELGKKLESETNLFRNVFYEVNADRLKLKGLQYLSPEQLQQVLDQLGEYAPLLRGDRFALLTLSKVARSLGQRIDETKSVEGVDQAELEAELEPLLQQVTRLAGSLDLFLQNQSDFLSPWPELIQADPERARMESRLGPLMNSSRTMGFIKAQPVMKENDFSGATASIDRIRALIPEMTSKYPSARIGLTGIPVLENDEMRESQDSMFKASVLSYLGVGLMLVLGFRGLRHPLVAIVMLAMAMAWSFGFTTLAVGHLNILSVSFAAMLVGLGIDFAIVYLTKYLELRHHGWTLHRALMETATVTGPGTLTAAVTTAVAFLAAILTDFLGIAELGIVAGGGIIICCIAAFVVLPAMVAIIDRHFPARRMASPFEGSILRRFLVRHPRLVLAGCALLIGLIAPHGFPMKYDANLLNLQARGLPSVEIQKRIFEHTEDGSILFAVSLADGPQQALELRKKFEQLPTVHHVVEIASMLPSAPHESTKLMVQAIHEMLSGLPTENPLPARIEPSVIGQEFERFEQLLTGFESQAAVAARLTAGQFLDRLSQLTDAEQVRLLREYQSAMTGDLLTKLRIAYLASSPEAVSPADLPVALKSRYVSAENQWLLQVYPKEEIWDQEPLERFIQDIRSVDPEATGTPLQTLEATRAIYRGYQQVGLYALVAVVVLVMLDFRRIGDTILALLPPAVGLLLTFGLMGLLDVPLNPANLIILPLIIGIGVDGGVHMVHDFNHQRRRYRPTASTFSAIILNSTTTMVGFGSMMIAAHRGINSLGLVLTLGVAASLFVSVVILPAMLSLMRPSRERHLHLAARKRPRIAYAHPHPPAGSTHVLIPQGASPVSAGS